MTLLNAHVTLNKNIPTCMLNDRTFKKQNSILMVVLLFWPNKRCIYNFKFCLIVSLFNLLL